ncbi:MAG: DUF1846 domain-containing protein [Oscillospiraceae bacterium]|jgi:uncharacterized protein (UPF0371 family)|nr:DUF1846 domain-containing protein [Oscillospiraceae bacterium]
MKTGFDSEQYMLKQTEHILRRIEDSQGKLYLEFGGKLFDDYHASRVLPGFDINGKVKLLYKLRGQTEIILCINARDIEKNKIRADIGITYELDVLRLIDSLRSMDLKINSVVITQFDGQPSAEVFRKKLEIRGETVFIHTPTKGYPTDIAVIASDEGYGANPYIPTESPLVVVTAPGPGSGKLATCLSQLYHEHKRGGIAGYAKFETFPIWNLPLKHPVNLAYEAATADLNDVNMIDPFHLEAYGQTTVNYNRDIEVFPIVRTILSKTTGMECVYKSPTDMGVNMAGFCITDDDMVRDAAKQEILRRYYAINREYKLGRMEPSAIKKLELIMSQLDITTDDRKVAAAALRKKEESGSPSVAVMLPDGSVVTGRTSKLMNAPASAVVNAIKQIAGIADDIYLIPPVILEPIIKLKTDNFGSKNPVLNLEEVLICLSICEVTNPTVKLAMEKLHELRGCEAHSSYIIQDSDERIMKRLGMRLTCEAEFPNGDLYFE